MPDWTHEDRARRGGHRRIAGLDEAGRGCLAGPVVAAAVIFLDRGACPAGLNDSKKLSRPARQKIYRHLTTHPSVLWATAAVSAAEIDQINILAASLRAMLQAVEALPAAPDFLLVDGNRLPATSIPGAAVIAGDAHCCSIAAASILAKETRDVMMETLDTRHPGYGFARHKGYGTREHLRALAALGPTPHHRRTFAPVAQIALPLTP